MDPLLLLIALGVGASVATLFVYGYEMLTSPARTVRSRIAPPTASAVPSDAPLRRNRTLLGGLVSVLPISTASMERMRLQLLQAGRPMTVEQYIVLRTLFAAGAAAAVAVLAPGLVSLPPWAYIGGAVVAAAVAWALPALYVSQLRQRRLALVERQLPEALTVIAKSLRAGTGLMQALGYAADEVPAPLGAEFRATLRELQLGADAEEAFEDLGRRVGSPDLDITVTAIVIQRSVGGNLSEILTTVSETIRERASLQAEIRVLTSRQRLTGNLMAAMPIIIAAAFISLNPEMGRLLIDTTAGRIALAIGLGFEVLGLVIIRRIAKIDI